MHVLLHLILISKNDPSIGEDMMDTDPAGPSPIPSESSTEAQTSPSIKPEEREAIRLATLRSKAQQHLIRLDEEMKEDEVQENKRLRNLEQETRRRKSRTRRDSPRTRGDSEVEIEVEVGEEIGVKKPRMRTAQDVLDRLRWDPSLPISQHRVGYLDRFGGIQELPVSEWIRESTDEEWIPQHRIRYFKWVGVAAGGGDDKKAEDEIVWHRDERIDRIFGSP